MLRSLGASAPVVVSETLVVLVVEENAVFRSITAERLRVAGFEVVEAANSAEAERVLKSMPVDALFLSVRPQKVAPFLGPIT
jgi:CheY-like chemotaxis protein